MLELGSRHYRSCLPVMLLDTVNLKKEKKGEREKEGVQF